MNLVMQFARTHDLDLVQRILTEPLVYALMGDDSLPPQDQFEVNRHPAIHYVTVRDDRGTLRGMFMLCPENSVCWQLHVVMLPGTKPAEKWAAARQFIPWLEENTGCRRLTAAVPSCNQRAVVYGTHGLGMNYVGRQEQAFLKFGILHDLILLGRSVGEHHSYEYRGEDEHQHQIKHRVFHRLQLQRPVCHFQ